MLGDVLFWRDVPRLAGICRRRRTGSDFWPRWPDHNFVIRRERDRRGCRFAAGRQDRHRGRVHANGGNRKSDRHRPFDTTFGTGGNTQIAFTDFINTPNSLALQPDGKVVAVGEATSADGTVSEFAVARFNSNGALDSPFGNDGKVTTNFVGVQLGGSAIRPLW